MSKESDQEYINKILSGDSEAFRYFITKYQEMATRVAFSIVQDKSKARHIVQSSFIQAFKHLGNFKQEAKFSTWLHRIVVNEAIKSNRKSQIERHTVPISANHTIALRTNNGAFSAEEFTDKREQINRVLALMKPKERLMLELFYLQERPIAEIKMITGFSISNIKVLLHRARKSFSSFFTLLN